MTTTPKPAKPTKPTKLLVARYVRPAPGILHKTLRGFRPPQPMLWVYGQVTRALDGGTLMMWERVTDGLRVLEGLDTPEYDERVWHHVSLSFDDHLPSWDDLKAVKRTFMGDEAEAYIVLPPASRYINDNSYVLHLWADETGEPVLPDFRRLNPATGRLTI